VTNTHSRRNFLHASITTGAAIMAVPDWLRVYASSSDFLRPPLKPSFPVTDYHVHLSEQLSIEQAVNLGKERGVNVGIVEHPGPGYKINTDDNLQHYIETLRACPVRIGLQPVYPGWSKAFSKSLLGQLDYVLMDALTLPKPDGGWTAIWQIDTFVDDAESFMTGYLQFMEQILTTEPIDIFGWPTFLPVPIARQYRELWTKPRMLHIIEIATSRKIAIEINEVAHVPDEEFIKLAKQAGLKFTFGTDSRTPQAAARLYYCYQMAQKCGVTEADMFTPRKKA
jgi:histidinol phosphatase-like PHP family hydrolase